ncbi:helix-turn-helix transcriptional regulator [Sphingomonas aliaeris]|uniref:Helix-turn-helix transcriptional regulator n=1 Tax=Sphingomonas aliaeris TaxID=2759526 RepID=A0A974NUP9_9SPHN|nr:helix-turn-helix transcriptional regulator [Sphingomonas aliaeris]QQV77271.1 helix-turn-helix transcriptional regulator [Sphingomonas aliaeris]
MTPRFDRVTEAQRECLRLVLTRRNSKEIALALGISSHTVDKRLERAIATLGATSRFDAARILAEHEAQSAPAPVAGADTTYEPFVYQSPDIVPVAGSDMVAASEELAQRGGSRDAKAAWLPIRPKGGRYNTLSMGRRLAWIGLIPVALAVAVGMLGFGLSVASKLFKLVATVLL